MFPLISSRYLLDKNTLVGHVSQILSIIFWTGGLVAMKPASTFAHPLIVVPAQMILGTIILFIIGLLFQRKCNYSSFFAGIGFGALAPGLAFTLNMIAATKTDILTITILWGLIPLLSPLLGRLFLSEPILSYPTLTESIFFIFSSSIFLKLSINKFAPIFDNFFSISP